MEEGRFSISRDTTLEAARVHAEVYRRTSPARRLQLAFAMSESLRRVMAGGVRSRHPNYSPQQVRLAVIRLALGDEWFSKVYSQVQIAV